MYFHLNYLAGQKKASHPDDVAGHPFPVVWKLFMQWLERILDHASNVIGTQIYPGIYDPLLHIGNKFEILQTGTQFINYSQEHWY